MQHAYKIWFVQVWVTFAHCIIAFFMASPHETRCENGAPTLPLFCTDSVLHGPPTDATQMRRCLIGSSGRIWATRPSSILAVLKRWRHWWRRPVGARPRGGVISGHWRGSFAVGGCKRARPPEGTPCKLVLVAPKAKSKSVQQVTGCGMRSALVYLHSTRN